MDQTDYEILGIQPGSDVATIEAAFRDKARKNHPDKGGNNEEMIRINRAHENILKKINNSHIESSSPGVPNEGKPPSPQKMTVEEAEALRLKQRRETVKTLLEREINVTREERYLMAGIQYLMVCKLEGLKNVDHVVIKDEAGRPLWWLEFYNTDRKVVARYRMNEEGMPIRDMREPRLEGEHYGRLQRIATASVDLDVSPSYLSDCIEGVNKRGGRLNVETEKVECGKVGKDLNRECFEGIPTEMNMEVEGGRSPFEESLRGMI